MDIQLINLEDFDVSSIRQGDELNVLVGEPTLFGQPDWEFVKLLFWPLPREVFLQAPADINWPRLLAQLGCFPSASQAAKNWRSLGREAEITFGFQTLTIGKARRVSIFLYKAGLESQDGDPSLASTSELP